MDITYTPPTMHVTRLVEPPRGRRTASYLARVVWTAEVRGPRAALESRAPGIDAFIEPTRFPSDTRRLDAPGRWEFGRSFYGDRSHSEGLRVYVSYERRYRRKEEVPESDECAIASLDVAIGKVAREGVAATMAAAIEAYGKAEQEDSARRLAQRQARQLANHLARKADDAARDGLCFSSRLQALVDELVRGRDEELRHAVERLRADAAPDGSVTVKTPDGSSLTLSPRVVEIACERAEKFFPAPLPTGLLIAEDGPTVSFEDL